MAREGGQIPCGAITSCVKGGVVLLASSSGVMSRRKGCSKHCAAEERWLKSLIRQTRTKARKFLDQLASAANKQTKHCREQNSALGVTTQAACALASAPPKRG